MSPWDDSYPHRSGEYYETEVNRVHPYQQTNFPFHPLCSSPAVEGRFNSRG